MTELRQDPTTHNWVILAPARGRRPHDHASPPGAASADPTRCPFCPGNEWATPPEVWRRSDGAGGWRVRVVPNRFPMLDPSTRVQHRSDRFGRLTMDGSGAHEVIVESPDHGWDLSTGSQEEVLQVLLAYRARYLALRENGAALIVIFRNHGVPSGTSLAHPHSQVVALPVVPALTRRRLDIARQRFDDLGTCLYVELVEEELADGRRVVAQTEGFVAYQPFAPSLPYETWIAPRAHQASFGEVAEDQLPELAGLLGGLLGALHRHLDDPAYNLVLHSIPPEDEGKRYFAWHLQVLPRLATPAGFELATGIPVNPSLPETTAAELRAAMAAARDAPR